MKRLFCFSLAAFMALSLCGCGLFSEPEETPAPQKSTLSVGVVLPGSAEDEEREGALLERLIKTDGRTFKLLYSHDSSATELRNVEELIEDGVQVLILRPNNAELAAAALQKAHDAGAVTVCYGALPQNSAAVDYYAEFSDFEAGALQGAALVSAYEGQSAIPLYLYLGGEDEASFERFRGAWSVLAPAVAAGEFILANIPALVERTAGELSFENDASLLSEIRIGSDAASAASAARADLSIEDEALKGAVAVLAPSDLAARAMSDVFHSNEEITSLVITGSGAEVDSLSYICKGLQRMTLWDSPDELAEAVCLMAQDILDDKTPETDALISNGSIDVPTRKVAPVAVTVDNINALIDAGVVEAEDIDGYGE